ncbi:MAG: aspartate kinase [Kofleriaceae bacterium]
MSESIENQHSTAWVVTKFGGTSVSTAARWTRISEIVGRHTNAGRRVLLVCSAVAGVTNQLEAVVASLVAGEPTAALLRALRATHVGLAASMGIDPALLDEPLAALAARVAAVEGRPTPRDRAAILSYGEVLSTSLGVAWLRGRGVSAAWVDARTLLSAAPLAPTTDPDADLTDHYLSSMCTGEPRPEVRQGLEALDVAVVVTQGFIARGHDGATVLLGRGGSDASGAYLAATIEAEALEIWTDVPGLFTADPRTVPDARLLQRTSYTEAEALGALGAKVIHPRTIEPCRVYGIPIRVGWTDRPGLPGTRIDGTRTPRGIKAVVARRGLALISMWRPSTWQPVGFMAEVAARFHRRGLSMDLISSSPSEIRVTVDLAAFPSAASELAALVEDLAAVCRPQLLSRVGCVSVVGDGAVAAMLRQGLPLDVFADAHVHLISHAGNGGHASVVVDERELDRLVTAAHALLVAPRAAPSVFGPGWAALTAPAVATVEEVRCRAS